MATASDAYKAAGVDIDLAQNLLKEVKVKIQATKRPEVLAPIGGFGGLFQLDLSKYREPVLVSSVDGVGTKLMVAAKMDKHDTVGYDIVNHCINDIAVQGAEPLYFMDYIGVGKLRSPLYEQVLGGIADACKAQNVALLGGETAEMPGMYGDDYDLVGCITGVVEKSRIINGDQIRAGNAVVGLNSSGLHTNGYSLARKVLFDTCGYGVDTELEALNGTVGDALLKPHTCYWPVIRDAMAAGLPLAGIAHITGGGLYDNIIRVMPDNVDVVVMQGQLPVPPIFEIIRKGGNIVVSEMFRVFNMGIGMVLMTPAESADDLVALATQLGFTVAVVGEITSGTGTVRIQGIDC